MPPLLGLERQQKRFLKIHFEFAYFSFFLIRLELVSSKTIPDSRPKSIPVFRPKRRKNHTLRSRTYVLPSGRFFFKKKALSSHPSSKRLKSKREAEPAIQPFKVLFVIGVS